MNPRTRTSSGGALWSRPPEPPRSLRGSESRSARRPLPSASVAVAHALGMAVGEIDL
jgi:hypothetical protein